MQVASYSTFVAYATLRCGRVRRLEVSARHQADALAAAFTICPAAVAMSARRAERTELVDALLQLDRRAA